LIFVVKKNEIKLVKFGSKVTVKKVDHFMCSVSYYYTYTVKTTFTLKTNTCVFESLYG